MVVVTVLVAVEVGNVAAAEPKNWSKFVKHVKKWKL